MADARSADVAETHVSVVFFAGDRAYKLKKPVSTGFLDFTDRVSRQAACHREVELNRRLAPDVYLGVADVVGPGGAVCDHLVVMRRMPAARRLSTLVVEGRAGLEAALREVARTVAAFHGRAETSARVAEAGTAVAVSRLWEDSLSELGTFAPGVLDPAAVARAAELARDYLAGRGPLLAGRVARGLVRDGHGDLLADDVFCLDDGPRILDCVEFDDRLRHGDVLADAAFLAMDLERLGRPDLGGRFLAWWSEYAGEQHPASLADHWIAYRALVRAKVACLRDAQGDPGAAREARRLLDTCVAHLERARVRLVLVGGLPGTGKSTLAAGLGDALGWTVLRSDEVRKELAGIPATAPAPAAPGEGLYAPARSEATYAELLRRAQVALALGDTVVLDASWSSAAHRAEAARVAADTSSALAELRCALPADEAAARIDRRARTGGDPSDATGAVAAAMATRTDPWPSAVTVATGARPGDALRLACDALGVPAAGRDQGPWPADAGSGTFGVCEFS